MGETCWPRRRKEGWAGGICSRRGGVESLVSCVLCMSDGQCASLVVFCRPVLLRPYCVGWDGIYGVAFVLLSLVLSTRYLVLGT